ncbi:MAG: hypothetical protein IT370_32095 [Deltaproteobacteria bacterium]|nr:hypothetical protein [Deltaproteobacteria bacterium]
MTAGGRHLGGAVALALLGLASCGGGEITGPRDTGLDGLALTRIDPGTIVPGTRLAIGGRSFVDDTLGATRLRLTGLLGDRSIDVALPAVYVSSARLELVADAAFADALGDGGFPTGAFQGQATVEVRSSVDSKLYVTAALTLELELAAELTPRLDAVGDGLSFVNQPTEVGGDGYLLGGDEGATVAILSGCFTPAGMTVCGPMVTVDLPAAPLAAFDRTRAAFPYSTAVSGIGPGRFDGSLLLENRHTGGAKIRSAPRTVRFDIQKPAILSASPTKASLGQYVIIRGGGFVGGGAGGDDATLIGLSGTFTPDGGGAARAIDLELVVEFRAGPEVRYVLDEDDPLGRLIDLRKESGTIRGSARPIVEKGRVRVEGDAIPVQLGIARLKQVVFINFLPSYVSSLRKFGLRAADALIRQRVLTVARRDYAGVNVEFRDTLPDDFALYAQVDIAGPDPNGLGLFGYDNSPGKDTDNERLYDRIGGVNATTQQDGYPGFGGVFTESLFGFSAHPPTGKAKPEQVSILFDKLVDPFRSDRGGVEVTATDLAGSAASMRTTGEGCPANKSMRDEQISCVIWAIGSMIGTTMTHEVGHSLGLANPYGDGFHDPGDQPNRLMDSGGARTFEERSELLGEGPSVFCLDEYDYLRMILPSADPAPQVNRPACD